MDLMEILKCNEKNESRWEKLVVFYKNSKIVPFIGAGMSAPIYPLWKNAILNIFNSGSLKEKKIVENYLNDNRYEEACEYVKGIVGQNGFIDRVSEEFSADRITKSSEEIRKKVNSRYLSNVFKGPVFTTNFDKMIEFFYEKDFDNSYNLSNMNLAWASIYSAIKENRHNIYKIHGDIDDANSWVFTKQEYETVYKRKEFVEVVETVCQNMNFLFLGCSLTEGDRYVELLANVTRNINEKGAANKNFAFMPLPDDKDKTYEQLNNEIEEKERYLNNIGVFPIWYPCEQHEAIGILLSALNESDTSLNVFKGDETGKEKHFNLFSSNISVQNAFVDDCFDVYNYSDLHETIAKPINLQQIIELAENNDLLYIEGDYGSGKTVLSTRIQWELKKNYKTLFFDAETFFENEELTEQLISFDNRCFVFVDGIDKLIDIDINLFELENFCERIEKILKQNHKVSFVVTSRMYCRIGLKKGNDLISTYVALQMQRNNLIVIRTKGFFDKNRYESFFSNIKPKVGGSTCLTANTIKKWHKKSPSSCQVPLFAYAIGTYFYDKQGKGKNNLFDGTDLLPDNKMIVYEDFVQKTIKGRFREESLFGTINEELYEKYEMLLRNLAIRMIHKMRDSINYEEDVSCAQEFSKDEAYEVKVNEFEEEIQRQLQEVVLASKTKEVFLSDAINNYFFTIKESNSNKDLTVRFSDLNVMCCFAAEYIYDVLIRIADYKDENTIKKEYLAVIKELGIVELQPQVMDFLICKIDALDEEVLDSLLSNILVFINSYNQAQVISEENVRAVLVLYIIFIKFWKYSYKSTGTLNFFKTFYRLCMTAKALNINGKHVEGGHRYLVERYFMNCTFIDYQFKRLNYKYYNFSNSTIGDSSFKQCNFLNNEFIGATIRKSCFKLCTIKTKFEKIKIDGVVSIDNSILDEVIFESIPENKNGSTLYFKGCTILKMTICNTENKFLKLFFENCVLLDIKIRKCKGVVVAIKDCVIKNKVSIDSNSNIYSNDVEFFDGDVKSLENLEDDDFRKAMFEM